MQTLKIKFGYFWPSFKNEDNYFTRVLSKKYKLEISDNPDFYFFTHPYNGKRDYLKYKCHRIFLGWENHRADWNICDYVLDSDFISNNPRHKRFPIWAGWNMQKLTEPKKIESFHSKKKFCCMLVSNAKAKERIDFFHELSKYKTVDSAGRYLNNTGRNIDDKMDFIKDYKFAISFENSSYPGYTTEKLIEPMYVNSIPVYWGNPVVGKDFNTRSFINISNKEDYQRAIEQITELDRNEDMYLRMAAEPWFNNNVIPEEMSQERLLQFFDFVIEDSKAKKPVGSFFIKDKMHRMELQFTGKVNRIKDRCNLLIKTMIKKDFKD